jgi:hypothetical protein
MSEQICSVSINEAARNTVGARLVALRDDDSWC